MANRVFIYIKSAAPTVNDDVNAGYKNGDNWLDTTNDIIYKSFDVTAGAAIWKRLVVNGDASPQFTTVELGHASDTTISRSAAGVLAVEGVVIPSISSTNTLTNKRTQPRLVTVTVHATPTYNTDNGDIFRIGVTGDLLDLAITSMTTNKSGTPAHGEMVEFEFLDDGTPRAITWGADFRSTSAGTLPTTTTASKLLRVLCQWDSADSKWDCVGVATES